MFTNKSDSSPRNNIPSNPQQTIIDETGHTPENIQLINYVLKSEYNEKIKKLTEQYHALDKKDSDLKSELFDKLNGQIKWYIGSLFTLVGSVIAVLKFIFHL